MLAEELERLLRWHLKYYPELGVEDVAKLLYQGVMGMDHLLKDPQKFREDFLQEWARLGGPLPGEPLFDPVSLDWRTARLHLRGAKARGWEPHALVEHLLAQPAKNGAREELLQLWKELQVLAHRGRLPWDAQDLQTVERLIQRGEVPHHSPKFQRLYQPAYRLVHDVRSSWITERLLGPRRG